MSRTFLNLLRSTLVLGNYMNHSTRLGSALGYRLNILPKIRDVRCTNGASKTPNMLAYIASRLIASRPDALSLSEEVPQVVTKEIKISLQDVASELTSIETKLGDAKYDLEASQEKVAVQLVCVPKQGQGKEGKEGKEGGAQGGTAVVGGIGGDESGGGSVKVGEGGEGGKVGEGGEGTHIRVEIISDNYQSVMTQFIEEATSSKNELLEAVQKCKKAFTEMVSHFGENAAALQSESEFWQMITDLALSYEDIHQRITKEVREEMKKEKWRQSRAQKRQDENGEDGGGSIGRKAVAYKRDGYGFPTHDQPERYVPWEGPVGDEGKGEGKGEGEGGKQPAAQQVPDAPTPAASSS